MMVKAILFGSIGTLVETSEIQRRAFNQAFTEAGLAWNWSVDTYKSLLKKSGGINRIQDYADNIGVNIDSKILHKRKNEIFDAFMAESKVPLRNGINNVIRFSKRKNIKLGFVTSTSKTNIDVVFSALNNEVTRDDFDFIGNDTMVTKPKPSPEIYVKALSDLGLHSQNCIAVEDTETSMLAAQTAGIRCIAFPGSYAITQDFSNALLITDFLSPSHFWKNT